MARKRDTRQPKHMHCAHCGRERRRPAKGHQSAIEAWLLDEFCSTECAKEFYGVPVRRSADFVNEERDFDLTLAEAVA